ncbi:MAG: hypothetical protein ACI9HB_002540 [Gammaproteobacteria bacterium]
MAANAGNGASPSTPQMQGLKSTAKPSEDRLGRRAVADALSWDHNRPSVKYTGISDEFIVTQYGCCAANIHLAHIRYDQNYRDHRHSYHQRG